MPLRRFFAGYRVLRTRQLSGARLLVRLDAGAGPFRVIVLRLEDYLARVERVYYPPPSSPSAT